MYFFVHGLGCDVTSMTRLAKLLCTDQKYHLFQMPRQETASFNGRNGLLNKCASLLAQEANKYEAVKIVSHSMGTAIALLALEKITSEVTSFVSFEGNLTEYDCGLLSSKLALCKSGKHVELVLNEIEENGDVSLSDWVKMAKKYNKTLLLAYSKELLYWSSNPRLLELFLNFTGSKMYFYGEDYRDNPTLGYLPQRFASFMPGTDHFAVMNEPRLCANACRTLVSVPY